MNKMENKTKNILIFLILLLTFASATNSCRRGEALLGGLCKVCSQVPSPVGHYYTYRNHCLHTLSPRKDFKGKTVAPEIPSDNNSECLGLDVVSSFFSYVSYSEQYEMLLSKWFSGPLGYPRIKGCGSWLSVNSFHRAHNIYIDAHAYFFINPQEKKVVLAFRGTSPNFASLGTWRDWMGNLYVELKDCPFFECGKVHAGFKKTYRIQKYELLQQAAEYLREGYEIILTGHSQGGSVSQLATVHFHQYFSRYSKKIKNYSFATPRTGNPDFAKRFDGYPNEGGIRYTARMGSSQDIVTTIPFPLMGYKHTKREVIVPCERKHFGNKNPPKDIKIKGIMPSLVPAIFGCHYQEVYLDGLINLKKKKRMNNKVKEAVSLINSFVQ